MMWFLRNNLKGFTLVETLAVTVVLSIFVGIAVVSVYGVIEKSKKAVCDANVVNLERMLYLVVENIILNLFSINIYKSLDYIVL